MFRAPKIKRLSDARCLPHGCAQPRRPSHRQFHNLAPLLNIALPLEPLQELAFSVLALALALAHADRGADAQLAPVIVGELMFIPDAHAGVRGLRHHWLLVGLSWDQGGLPGTNESWRRGLDGGPRPRERRAYPCWGRLYLWRALQTGRGRACGRGPEQMPFIFVISARNLGFMLPQALDFSD